MLNQRHSKPIKILIALALFLAQAAAAQKKIEPPSPEAPVRARADSLEYDRENDILYLRGSVEIQRPPFTIYAPALAIDLKTNLAAAENGLRIVRSMEGGESEVLSAQKAEINLESQTGYLAEGKLALETGEGRITISGTRIERISENQYLFQNGSFTSCQCREGQKADWELRAREISADTEGSVKVRSARVMVREKAVLYLPYFEYPLTDDRTSGFLPPELGYSSRYGYKAGMPYYQTLGPSADLTIYPYWLSEAGFYGGADFRHNLGGISAGLARGFGIQDSREHRFRWSGVYQGESEWSSGRLREDLTVISDNEYVLDFDQDFAYRWQKQLDSSILFSQNLPGSNLSGEFTRFDDLAGHDLRKANDLRPDTDRQQIWLLPAIRHQVFNRGIYGPLGFDMSNGLSYYYRQDQGLGRGAALDLIPRLTYTPSLQPGVKMLAYAGYRGMLLYPEPEFSETVSFIAHPLAGTRTGLSLEKIFGAGETRYRHVIEPEVEVIYQGKSDSPDDRFFPGLIGPLETGQAGVRLNSLLYRKRPGDSPGAQAPELVSEFEFSQYYDWVSGQWFDAELKGSAQDPGNYGLNADLYYNFDQGELHRGQVQAWVQDRREDRLWVGYLYAKGELRSSWYSFPQTPDENWTGGANLKLTDQFNAGYRIAYSVQYDAVVSQSIRMDYLARQKCWAAGLTLGQHIDPEQPEKHPIYSTMFNFQILGLSKVLLGSELDI